MILTAIALALLTAGPAGTVDAGGAEPDLHLVVARTDGTHVKIDAPLTEEQFEGVRHVWAWTADLPPQQLETTRASSGAREIIAELRRVRARRLEVQVGGWLRSEETEAIRVIAAPAEMWRSVPEPLLPSYPVSKEGRTSLAVRDPLVVRVIGEDRGSLWQQVAPGATSLAIDLRSPAADAQPVFRSSDDATPGRVFALVLSDGAGQQTPVVQARFVSDEDGAVRIPALPESEVVTIFVISEKGAPLTISGTAANLSRVIRLPVPIAVTGKFVDEHDRGVAGARVEVEGWVSPAAPVASRGDAVSDDTGLWVVPGLPAVDVIVRASAAGRSAFRRRVSLKDGDVDLGTIVLPRSKEVVLTVSDQGRRPVASAEISSDSGFEGRTGQRGSVTLTGLPPDEPTSVTVRARGFRPRTVHLTPPLPREEHVVLERTFAVKGSVIDEDGAVVVDGFAIVTIGRSYKRESLGPDGTFSFEIQPGEEFEVAVESPNTSGVTLSEPPGRAGEVRNLGTIRLPAGRTVRGRITDQTDLPLRGVRVWAIRPTPGGVVAGWAAGRVVQAMSADDGAFELRGLAAGPATLRIDAADFARAYRDIAIDAEPVDLGAIALLPGRTVVVKVDHDEGAVARLDLRGLSIDVDMVTAPVWNGEARLRHVAPGQYKVSVVAGHSVICDSRVDVKDRGEAVVECLPPPNISGRVLIDGVPAFGGTLVWIKPYETDALIQNRTSPMGAVQQRIYGMGGGTIVVPVKPDGTFVTDELRAGEWQVGWRSTDGAATPDRTFSVPDTAQAQLLVSFAGGVIEGRVLDSGGKPVTEARIRQIQGPLHTIAGNDGSFTMKGVPPGTYRLQASHRLKTSAIADVRVEAGKRNSALLLELRDTDTDVLTVAVIGAEGQPKARAFVFVEVTGIIKIVSADSNGVATVSTAEGLPDAVRVVAFAENEWAFSEYRRRSDPSAPQAATVRFGRTGTLEIRSRTASGVPTLTSPHVPGDLLWMLGRMGSLVTVTPQAPAVIHGLPPGSYEVRLGSERGAASVVAGSAAKVDLQ